MSNKYPKINIGDKFGRLTVTELGEPYVSPKGKRMTRWVCECICGNAARVVSTKLHSGHTSSCGCFKAETVLHHGHNRPGKRTPVYRVYDNMKGRCYNPNATGYEDYGGRGIAMCERWLEESPQGFLNFLEDMGDKPHGTLLDRVDPNKDYNKENCRWIDRSMSNFNRRRLDKNSSGRTGVMWAENCSRWIARITKDSEEFVLGYFVSFKAAVRARENAEIIYFGELKPEARVDE